MIEQHDNNVRRKDAPIEGRIFSPNLYRNTFDFSLLFAVLVLLAIGLVMVYSATISGKGLHASGDQEFYLIRQAIYIGVFGVFFLVFASFISMDHWQKLTIYIVIVSLILLVLVLFFGTEVGLTRRWISLGFFNVQPAELFKIACIFYLASFLIRREDVVKNFGKVWWGFIVPSIGIALIYIGGDFGISVIIFVVAAALLLIGGLRIKWFIAALSIGFVTMFIMIMTSEFRRKRVLSFISSEKDTLGAAFQPEQAAGALARAGWDGVGLGKGLSRFYLPEIHNDYIYALTMEELGIVLGLMVLLLYTWIAVRAFMIGSQALKNEFYFSAYVAKGISVLIAIQSFLHFGVNLTMLPSKGLTLPFVSYGGSSMLVSMACLMLLLRIDYENRQKARGFTK